MQCHVADLHINRDRRVGDVETSFDPVNGIFNNFFATVRGLFTLYNDGSGFPAIKLPNLAPFLVKNISRISRGTTWAPIFTNETTTALFVRSL